MAKGVIKGGNVGGMAGMPAWPVVQDTPAAQRVYQSTKERLPATPPPPAPPAPRPEPTPAAIVNISDAGRAALASAQPPTPQNPGGTMIREMTTGADWEYRVYGPGHAHWGSASFKAQDSGQGASPAPGASSLSDTTTGSDQFQTTSPGRKSPGEVLGTMAHEAAHVVQQSVRLATGDLDGDGRADVAVAGPPSGTIQGIQTARHDAAMAAIQNIR
jgi:hypothetical protein